MMLIFPFLGSGGRDRESCLSGLKVNLVNFTFKRSNTQIFIQVDGFRANSLFYRKESLKAATTLGCYCIHHCLMIINYTILNLGPEEESQVLRFQPVAKQLHTSHYLYPAPASLGFSELLRYDGPLKTLCSLLC